MKSVAWIGVVLGRPFFGGFGLSAIRRARGTRHLVIVCATRDVRQHLVGIEDLLEFSCRVQIAGITIGMKAENSLAVSPFDLVLACAASDSQDGIIIGICVQFS